MRPAVRGVCSQCNTANSYTSVACSQCGARLPWADAVSKAASKEAQNVQASQEPVPQESAASRDRLSFASALQGFLSPLEGFILYFGLRKETPLRAKSIALGAISSTVLVLIVLIVFGFLFVSR